MKAEELIRHFYRDIYDIGGPNLFIAGSCALQLHGFKMDWEPSDLDVIIYMPTDQQDMTLQKEFDGCSDYETDDKNTETLRRVYEKIIPVGNTPYKLNVICEYKISIPEPPYIYLTDHKYQIGQFKINPVANILNAIISYKRQKDKVHIKSLINLNFNERK